VCGGNRVSDIHVSARAATPFCVCVFTKPSTVKGTLTKMSTRKRLESFTLGDLRNELRRYGMTLILTTKAKCIEELTFHLEEEKPLDNFVKDQTHKVDRTPNQPSKRANRNWFDYPTV